MGKIKEDKSGLFFYVTYAITVAFVFGYTLLMLFGKVPESYSDITFGFIFLSVFVTFLRVIDKM